MTQNLLQNIPHNSHNFLKFLGNPNEDSLRITLDKAFEGDSYEQNNRHTFDNFFNEVNEGSFRLRSLYQSDPNPSDIDNNILMCFANWGQEKLDNAFSSRFKIAVVSSIFLAISLAITMKLNFFAGVALASITTVTSAIAEGVAKRNIATYGHLSQHLTKKISAVNKKIINDYIYDPDLDEGSKKKLLKLKSQSYTKTSAMFRGLSYFSGFSVNAFKNITERLVPSLSLATLIIGFIIPILPILTTLFSKVNSFYRQKTIRNEANNLNELHQIINNQNSWKRNVVLSSKLEEFNGKFKDYLEKTDNHGKLPNEKGYHKLPANKKDHSFNPSKAVIVPAWISAKIHRKIAKFFKTPSQDIAKINPSIRSVSDIKNSNPRITSCITFLNSNFSDSNLNQVNNQQKSIEISSKPGLVLFKNNCSYLKGSVKKPREITK